MAETDLAPRDRDIRKLIVGYSDDFIAGLIGKKRPAFNKGISTKDHYLSREEWGMIVEEMTTLQHPKLAMVLARLKERGFEYDMAKSRTPLLPVQLHQMELSSIGMLFPYPDLWASKFPASFQSLCTAIRQVAGPGKGKVEFRVSAYFSSEALFSLVADGLGLKSFSDAAQFIEIRAVSDPEKLPHVIQVELKNGIKEYYECVDERMIPIDKDLTGRIYLHALTKPTTEEVKRTI